MKHKTLGVNGIMTATTVEGSSQIIMSSISLLKNDDQTNDLYINFDANTTSANTICLKAGESIEDWDVQVSTVYYRASASTINFRLIGLNTV